MVFMMPIDVATARPSNGRKNYNALGGPAVATMAPMRLETIATELLINVSGGTAPGASVAAFSKKLRPTRKNAYRELMTDRYNDATSPRDWE